MAKDKVITKPAAASGLSGLADTLVFCLLTFTIFIIPLYFNIGSYDQFEMPKLTLLRVLTCVMLALWAVRIFDSGKLELVKTPLDFPMLALALMNIVTTFTSFAPHLSFRGEYENFAGSLTNLNYIVLYFIAVNFLRTAKRVYTVNAAFLIAGLVTTIYALGQFFGYDIIKWNEGSMIKGRYFASMGNPNFLGALLIMMMPVNIAFFVNSFAKKRFTLSALFFVLFAALYLALFGTQSRGPFLGFITLMALFSVYGLYRLYKSRSGLPEYRGKNPAAILVSEMVKHKTITLIAAAVIAISLIAGFTLGKNATGRLWHAISHPVEALSNSRLHIWEPALRIIRDYPLLGTGVDTFKSIFPKYEGTNFAVIDGANVSSRTAHNELLNIWSTMGGLTLGVYILMLWAYLKMWLKSFGRIKDPDYKMISFAMFAAVAAYFVQNLFSFGVAAINTAFYLFLAMASRQYGSTCGEKKLVLDLYGKNNDSAPLLKTVLILVCVALFSFLGYKSLDIYKADVCYNRGKIYGNIHNRWDLAIAEHLKSVELAPGEVKYHVYLGLAYEKMAMATQDIGTQKSLLHKAASAYTKGVTINPGNSYYWGNLGRVYVMLGRIEDPSYLGNAEKSYMEAVSRAPVTGLFYGNLIELYLSTGRMEQAMELLEKLQTFDKKTAASSYFLLGNQYFQERMATEAEVCYRKALELDPKLGQAYFNLGVVCASRKDRDCTELCMKKFIELSPGSDMIPHAEKIMRDLGIKY
ncbi:MAG: O-antigen ligase family protein [Spirochaetia bacterium]|nr:O-antigen ligase family protein [Spirochaetia bacterium]